MTDQSAQEPTMEEILASIRRIISEDDVPAPAEAETAKAEPAERAPVTAAAEPANHAPAHQDDDDVLELTDRFDAPEPEPAPPPARSTPEPVSRAGDLDIFDREPEPAKAALARAAPPPASSEDGLVGAAASATAASAFGQLSQRVSLPADGQSLEDVVRELLKPLLRDWLDRNLPAIVEARVQAEVERISRLNTR